MYFVPVRKIFKVLFTRAVSSKRERTPLSLKECMEAAPECRKRYRRRWLLLFVIPVFVYIAYYHTNTRSIVIVDHQNASKIKADNAVNQNQVHVVKKTDPQYYDVHMRVDDQDNIQSKGDSTIVETEKSVVINQTHDISTKSGYNSTVLDDSTNHGGKPRPPINLSPVCNPLENHGRNINIEFSDVHEGGYYYPSNCRSRHKVAILVPYRNRERSLSVFVFHMHPFLIRQQLEYRIFVIEQAGTDHFNRGKLFNVGFVEMGKYNDWHCVVLHDVDLLPLSDEILYTCPTFPRHMCGTVVEKANLSYDSYHTLFGGVSALTVRQYKQINGFSNLYWGWGGEDNDMYWRILSVRLPVVRYNKTVAKFTSLPHPGQPKNKNRYRLLRTATTRYKVDGLSSLAYKVIWTKYRHLYTHILADINPTGENVTNSKFLV